MYLQNRFYILVALVLLSVGVSVTRSIVFPLVSLCLALIMLGNEPRKFFKCGVARTLAYFFDCLNCIQANYLFEIISFVCAMYMCIQMIRNIYNKDDDHTDNPKRKSRFTSLTQLAEKFIHKTQLGRA
jgi:hypothetical protein